MLCHFRRRRRGKFPAFLIDPFLISQLINTRFSVPRSATAGSGERASELVSASPYLRQRLIHESRLLSYFHRRRKFNALSSVSSPLHLSLQPASLRSDRSIFADAARSAGLTLGLTSFAARGRSEREPEESVSPSMGSMIENAGDRRDRDPWKA